MLYGIDVILNQILFFSSVVRDQQKLKMSKKQHYTNHVTKVL